MTTTGTSPASAPQPLAGVRVVSIAVNLPGPAAASRLTALGAEVTKIEPPSGDPLRQFAKAYYDELVDAQSVEVLDLKEDSGRSRLHDLLADADLLITSHRTVALERLGLGWDALHGRHPRLSHVAIVGHPAPGDNLPGHDLTYQAVNGMLPTGPGGPAMPTVLAADLTGAERAVSEGLAALVQRAATGAGSYREVALSTAAEAMAAPLRHGLTAPGGLLGGALPAYRIYPTAEGHVAVAAIEPHFSSRLFGLLGVSGTREELETAFASRTAAEWQAWAEEHDLPIAEVLPPGESA